MVDQSVMADVTVRKRGAPNIRRLSILLFLSYSSLISIFQGIQNILLPPTVQSLAPNAKVATLALLTTLAAVAAVAALFAGGAVSDRTRSRWGRRTPSLVISCVASLAMLPLMGAAKSIAVIAVLLPLLMFALNYFQSVLMAALPDRVPAESLGFASAAIGLGGPAGIFVGVNIAALSPNIPVGYILLGIPFAVLTACLVLLEPEPSSLDDDPRPLNRASFGGIVEALSSLRSRDFRLALVSRFLLFLCYFTVNGYIFYIVQDYVGADRIPVNGINYAVSIILSLITLSWVVVIPVIGFLSDRFGRTALVVGLSGLGVALVTMIPAANHTWISMILFGLGTGAAFGTYFSLDLKLATLVLPSSGTAGRDLGLLLAAGTAPLTISPVIAAAIIDHGSYPLLFLFGALIAALGGVCAFLIQGRT